MVYEFYVANKILISSTHQALLLIQSQSKMSLQSHPIVLPQLMILINISVQIQPIGLVILQPNVSRSPCKSTPRIQVRKDELKHDAYWLFVLFEHNHELHKFPIYLQDFVRTRWFQLLPILMMAPWTVTAKPLEL